MRGMHATESQCNQNTLCARPTTLSTNKHEIFKSQSNSCETKINTITKQSLQLTFQLSTCS